jgi:WD40 repeat protein
MKGTISPLRSQIPFLRVIPRCSFSLLTFCLFLFLSKVEVTQSCVVLLYFLDKKVTVWNVRTGESKILVHPRSVRCIATNDLATHLLSGGMISTSLLNLRCPPLFLPSFLLTSPSLGYDGCLRFWNLSNGTCFKCCRDAHGKRSIDFIRCNQWKAVTASAAGLSTDIKVWDMNTGNCLQVVKVLTDLPLSLSLSPISGWRP